MPASHLFIGQTSSGLHLHLTLAHQPELGYEVHAYKSDGGHVLIYSPFVSFHEMFVYYLDHSLKHFGDKTLRHSAKQSGKADLLVSRKNRSQLLFAVPASGRHGPHAPPTHFRVEDKLLRQAARTLLRQVLAARMRKRVPKNMGFLAMATLLQATPPRPSRSPFKAVPIKAPVLLASPRAA